MPATAANKTAVAQALLLVIRKLDLEGYLNQDNASKVSAIYPISNFTTGDRTVITLADAATAANFQVGQVVKFFNITDSTLASELHEVNTSQFQRTIIDITNADITINLDSSNFAGSFVSGDISTTINMTTLETYAGYLIADFELDTGIAFDSSSHIHMSLIKDAAYLFFTNLAGGEKILLQARYDKRIEQIRLAKGISWTSDDVDMTDYNEDSDFSSDEFKQDMGFGIGTESLTD